MWQQQPLGGYGQQGAAPVGYGQNAPSMYNPIGNPQGGGYNPIGYGNQPPPGYQVPGTPTFNNNINPPLYNSNPPIGYPNPPNSGGYPGYNNNMNNTPNSNPMNNNIMNNNNNPNMNPSYNPNPNSNPPYHAATQINPNYNPTAYGGPASAGVPTYASAPHQQSPSPYPSNPSQPQAYQPPSSPQAQHPTYTPQPPSTPQQDAELRLWFDKMDKDNSGKISASELSNVAIGGVRLGNDASLKLIKIFDVSGDGEIEFGEYMALHKYLMAVQTCFLDADADKNGRLKVSEIEYALRIGGFQSMSPGTLNNLFGKYDENRTGLDMKQFISLLSHIALAKTSFDRLDTDRDDRVTLSFDQIVNFTALL